MENEMDTQAGAGMVAAGSTGRDPMEAAGETPDIAVLQQELQWAWDRDTNGYSKTAWKENIRYARWAGQTEDGLKNRKHMGDRAKPYDGAPDTRPFLTDGIINNLVDLLYAAFFGARVKTAPTAARTLNAAQAAEWRAIIAWMIHGPLRTSLVDDVEFAAQLQGTLGWCVLHPTWRKETIVKMQTVTMEQVMQIAEQARGAGREARGGPARTGQGGEPGVQTSGGMASQGEMAAILQSLPQLVKDPALEDAAVETFMGFFPGVGKREARGIVRDLRQYDEAEFPVEAEGPNVPALRVLVPGQHFVLPPESTALGDSARWMPVREFLSEAALRQRAQEEEWNPEFVERVCKTKGLSLDEPTQETAQDDNLLDIEIFYLYARQNNEHGVPGMYCTVFSMFVGPGARGAGRGAGSDESCYGYHRLVDFGHGEYPFIFLQSEVTGLRPMDARGVPETMHTQQNQMKNSLDLTYIYQQMSVVPPLQKTGTQASKLPPGLAPLGIVNNVTGGEWKWFNIPPGNPEIALKLIAYIEKSVEDYYGILRADTPPAKSMSRQQRMVMRWLAKWGEALWQLSVLAYQNLSKAELTEILGRPPLLTADTISKQRLVLWFETRTMDSDWLDDMIKNIMQLLQVDTGGTIDRSKLVQFVLAYLDPTLADEVTVDQAGAGQAMFKEVRDEVNSMRLGNKPMPRENDPTAKMKLGFLQQIIASNPEHQVALAPTLPTGQPNPKHDPMFAENLKNYADNLQHNYQEMVLSKQQGRLGIADTGGGPVAQGTE